MGGIGLVSPPKTPRMPKKLTWLLSVEKCRKYVWYQIVDIIRSFVDNKGALFRLINSTRKVFSTKQNHKIPIVEFCGRVHIKYTVTFNFQCSKISTTQTLN